MYSITIFTRCLVIVEALAAITGFITWHKWKGSYLKWFPIYLAVITGVEFCYHLLNYFDINKAASQVYDISILFEMLFLFWFLYRSLNAAKRQILKWGAVAYIVSWIAENTLLKDHTYYFESISYTVANLFILVGVILFFIELTRTDRILSFRRLTVFWIISGLLVFYLGSFPFYGLYNELAKNIDIFMAIAWVSTFLNYCMYSLFIIGFIWGKPH